MAEIYDCCVIGKEDGGKTMLKLLLLKTRNLTTMMKQYLLKRLKCSVSRTFQNGLFQEKLFSLMHFREQRLARLISRCLTN